MGEAWSGQGTAHNNPVIHSVTGFGLLLLLFGFRYYRELMRGI